MTTFCLSVKEGRYYGYEAKRGLSREGRQTQSPRESNASTRKEMQTYRRKYRHREGNTDNYKETNYHFPFPCR